MNHVGYKVRLKRRGDIDASSIFIKFIYSIVMDAIT